MSNISGFEAVSRRDDGTEVVPASDADWRGWVAATRTRSFFDDDPLLDWLDTYGQEHGFRRDEECERYNPDTDFVKFVFRKGVEFEAAVLRLIRQQVAVTVIAETADGIRSVDNARLTVEAMQAGAEVISRGVLWNPQDKTYGAPDLLVRSDVLRDLFVDALSKDEAQANASGLGDNPWHYRVVDVKFTTLDIDRSGHEKRGHMAYMGQVFVYNEALSRIQGYTPPSAYLLGRGWKTSRDRGKNCLERLSRVEHDGVLPLREMVAAAIDWVRRAREEGSTWRVLPEPSVSELWPNMSNRYNHPWGVAKDQIAGELKELTALWQVGLTARQRAHAQGITRWSDPKCCAATLGVTGESRPALLDRVIEVNRASDGPPLQRGGLGTSATEWRSSIGMEFYVDFETVNNLDDDFTGLPEAGGQELIFMVGCGHLEDGQWSFRSFVADELTEESEAAILDAWFEHMEEVAVRLGFDAGQAMVMHWSKAESVSFETAYNSAKARHGDDRWPSPTWFDFLQDVVRTEPVVVRGAMGFGLKAMAQAMYKHGLISTQWGDGPVDGLGAMVGAWSSYAKARGEGIRVDEVPLMREIAAYNEVDCRVMMEIVEYLREQ